MGIFGMNSSEFNEPCHEISHQNSNNDNCHQETNCWDLAKKFLSSRIVDVKGTKESSAMLYAMQLLFYIV